MVAYKAEVEVVDTKSRLLGKFKLSDHDTE